MSEDQNDQDSPVGLPEPEQPTQDSAEENQTGNRADPSVPPKKFWNRKRVDHRTWDAIYLAWKPGNKSAKQLGRDFGISDDTVCRFISKGVTSMGWPSYRQRLHLEKSAVQEAANRAADQIAHEIIGEAREIRQRNLNIAKAGCAVLGHMVGRIMKQIETTPMTRSAPRVTQVVRADGSKETIREIVQRPMDMYEAGHVLQKISGSLSQLSRVEVAVLGIKDPEDPTSDIPESEKLTQAEVDYINTHDGQLPEGMTMEQFIQRGGLAYGLQFTRSGQG